MPHHLIDFVPPHINYTAGEWAREAVAKIDEIEARGAVPILVGGTGLYLRALRAPFFLSPPTDEALRHRLNTIRETRGPEYLHAVLKRLDRQALELFPRDWQSVQRAIEFDCKPVSTVAQKLNARQPMRAQRLRLFVLNQHRSGFTSESISELKAICKPDCGSRLARSAFRQTKCTRCHGYRRPV